MIDLQIQTTASDGKFLPRECVRMASENGVTTIAITDHDTVDGVTEAIEAGKEFGVEVIPGIELSCGYEGRMIHVLGLGIDYQSPHLLRELVKSKNFREERAQLIVEGLQNLGFVVDFERVRARAKGVIARPHIADEVMEHPANAEKLKQEGIITKQDFFNIYIGDNGKVDIPSERLSVEEAVRLIHGARGVAIWSHPTWPAANRDFPWIEETLRQFMRWEIDGVEAFMDSAPEDDIEFLVMLAGKYKLLKSAGSDFHDTYVDPKKPAEGSSAVGAIKTYGFSLDGIRDALLDAIEEKRRAAA